MKILFTGTTSSGKTTVMAALKRLHIPGVFIIDEQARRMLRKQPGLEKNLLFQDLLFTKQCQLEEFARRKKYPLILCDRGALDIVAHAQLFSHPVKEEWLSWSKTYDKVLYFDKKDIPFEETPLQRQIDNRDWEAFRDNLDEHILYALYHCGLPFETISGTVEERVSIVETMIKWHLRQEGQVGTRVEGQLPPSLSEENTRTINYKERK